MSSVEDDLFKIYMIIVKDNLLTEFNKQIEIADDRLKKIDEKGTFKSDDEIGWFFSQIKVIQESISKFKTDYNDGTN